MTLETLLKLIKERYGHWDDKLEFSFEVFDDEVYIYLSHRGFDYLYKVEDNQLILERHP